MVEQTDEEFFAYAEHFEQMVEASQSEEDKVNWLTLAAAWRRKCTDQLNGTYGEPE